MYKLKFDVRAGAAAALIIIIDTAVGRIVRTENAKKKEKSTHTQREKQKIQEDDGPRGRQV